MKTLQEEVNRLQRAEYAPTTRWGYSRDYAVFEAWCSAVGRAPLPATPETVRLFVADRLLAQHSVPYVARQVCGIAFQHREAGYPSPVDQSVHKTLAGARRLRGEMPRQARPVTVDELRRASEALALIPGPVAARDRAIVLLGFASALRRSNLAALELADLKFCEGGLLIWVGREKNDRKGDGRVLAVPFGQHVETCPVRSIEAWLAFRGRERGPLFTRFPQYAGRPGNVQPITAGCIWRIVKGVFATIGVTDLSPHSLRAGLITSAGQAGASLLAIAKTSGHRDLDSIQRYFRPTDLLKSSVSKLIGL